MAITTIGNQLTPGRPIQVTFAPNTGLPSNTQTLLIIGHQAATGISTAYEVATINAVSDVDACTTEVNTKFGTGSELAKMIIAAVKANALGGTFPPIKAIPLASTDTDFGDALTNAKKITSEILVSPYDGNTSTENTTEFKTAVQTMSGPSRVDNNQFGSIGVVANLSVADPSTLVLLDSPFLAPVYMRDSGTHPYSVGELAASYAAMLASNGAPFNPLDNVVIPGVSAPTLPSDWLSIGAGLESETVLTQGWSPLRVLPNGDVAIVRSRTARTTSNGITPVTAYFDVQDFQVLYFWRKTLWTRFTQPDMTQTKASEETADKILSEVIRLASAFEDQGMFQSVSELVKQFIVQRNTTDRSRFDVYTPVNVVPGLHVIATNVSATTQFDTISV